MRRIRSMHMLGSSRSEKPLPDIASLEPAKYLGLVRDPAPGNDVPAVQYHESQKGLDDNVEPGIDASAVSDPALTDQGINQSMRSHRSNESIALHKMQISQQLRSLSQLSDSGEVSDHLTPEPWTFHRRERSNVGVLSTNLPATAWHRRCASGSGVDSLGVPSSWGRVRPSSSIYSRPTSPEAQVRAPYDIDAQLADWPLKTSEPAAAPETVQQWSASECSQAADEPTHTIQGCKNARPLPAVDTVAADTSVDVVVDDQSQASASIPSKSSSSTLNKRTRFLERFSPTKKTVKKRRSIFKFLRPGSHREQPRSTSTPMLLAGRSVRPDIYDGPSDGGQLLTVQYDLSEQPPSGRGRSVSTSRLEVSNGETTKLLTVPGAVRRPTLAEYERRLSVSGDSRRRPSNVNVQTLKDIEEDERRDSLPVKRKLSRATPLNDDASPLMKSALQRHQQEKALFRSASKHSEATSAAATPLALSFATTSWTGAGSSSKATTPDRRNTCLDPLEAVEAGPSSQRRPSTSQLLLPGPPNPVLSRRVSLALPPKPEKDQSSNPYLAHTTSTGSLPSKIGTNLSAWSRYPSHTRAERCGSAGPRDDVFTRDFAFGIDSNAVDIGDEGEMDQPNKKKLSNAASKSSKGSLPRSGSGAFGAVKRYYSNVFSSFDLGQGRRSSIATGGRLEHPELELLPPVMPEYTPPSASSHHHHLHMHSEHLAQIKEHVKDDADKLLHHHHHEHKSQTEEGSQFREGSPFRSDRASDRRSLKREVTMLGPMDGSHERIPANESTEVADATEAEGDGKRAERALSLDGTADEVDAAMQPSSSKAQYWSATYQDCLTRPQSTHSNFRVEHEAVDPEPVSMPPPALKPVKARSPHNKSRSPVPKVRSYPSVTVIDDQKGHWRSVSFVSVNSRRSNSFVRESSHDLLALMKATEREERDKLMRRLDGVC